MSNQFDFIMNSDTNEKAILLRFVPVHMLRRCLSAFDMTALMGFSVLSTLSMLSILLKRRQRGRRRQFLTPVIATEYRAADTSEAILSHAGQVAHLIRGVVFLSMLSMLSILLKRRQRGRRRQFLTPVIATEYRDSDTPEAILSHAGHYLIGTSLSAM